jgi:hypothetical protein
MRGSHLIAVVAVSVIACGTDPTEDPSRCLQTFEFGNTGCGELTGLVTDHLGAPVPGAFIEADTPADPAGPVTLVSGFVQTDATGSYRIRAIRMAGNVPVDRPDTVTVWVRASVPPGPDVPVGTPGPVDSLRALLEIRPVGEPPAVTAVETIAISDL